MIRETIGDILRSNAEALINVVNTASVLSKGVALKFQRAFPANFDAYRRACERGELQPGRVFVYHTGQLANPKYILNFPAERHWLNRARLTDIRAGLDDLVRIVRKHYIRSIALPALGYRSGGLAWTRVRPLITEALTQIPDVTAILYVPPLDPNADADFMPVDTMRPNMNANRGALLLAMAKYALPGYRLTLLEMQKLAYFLQRAGQPLKLEFVQGSHGPYAEDMKAVAQRIEGHFIRGYGDRARNSSICILPAALLKAQQCLLTESAAGARLDRVNALIEGFETPYGMELLATVHWISAHEIEAACEPDIAVARANNWGLSRRRPFKGIHIRKAWERLKALDWLCIESGSSCGNSR